MHTTVRAVDTATVEVEAARNRKNKAARNRKKKLTGVPCLHII